MKCGFKSWWVVGGLLFLFVGQNVCAETGDQKQTVEKQQSVLEDVTIIVSSCDRYSDFWEPFFVLLFKNWPSLQTYNRHVPILFITNQKPFSSDRVTVLRTGKDYGWSQNLLMALEKVKTKYVLYMQEDYFLSKSVDEKFIYYLVQSMKDLNIPYIQTNGAGPHKGKPFFPYVRHTKQKGKHEPFRTSLQTALWETETLKWLIVPEESAWDFEEHASRRSEGIRAPFLAVPEGFGYEPFVFLNACHVGFWEQSALDFLKKENIPVMTSLPSNGDYKFTYWLKTNKYKFFRRMYRTWTRFLGLFDPKFSASSKK